VAGKAADALQGGGAVTLGESRYGHRLVVDED